MDKRVPWGTKPLAETLLAMMMMVMLILVVDIFCNSSDLLNHLIFVFNLLSSFTDLLAECLEFFRIFLIIERILDVDQSLIILQKTEEHLVLGVWNWIVSYIEYKQVLLRTPGEIIADLIESPC